LRGLEGATAARFREKRPENYYCFTYRSGV